MSTRINHTVLLGLRKASGAGAVNDSAGTDPVPPIQSSTGICALLPALISSTGTGLVVPVEVSTTRYWAALPVKVTGGTGTVPVLGGQYRYQPASTGTEEASTGTTDPVPVLVGHGEIPSITACICYFCA